MSGVEAGGALPIIYRDAHLVAVHKPAGLLVHRSLIDRHEKRFLLQSLRDQIGQRVYPVHRLDKPTAGLIVFALDRDTARILGEQFSQGLVCKEYLAICRGYSDVKGRIDYPLSEEADPISDAQADEKKPPQEAVTDYQRWARLELAVPVGRYHTARFSLLHLQPRNGRKHQLRRHLKHIFHPIVGDTTHGDGRQNRCFREHLRCHDLMLCSWRLSFQHPYRTESLQLQSFLPATMSRVLAQPEWQPESNFPAGLWAELMVTQGRLESGFS